MTESRNQGARARVALLLIAAVFGASGCMTKTVRTPVFQQNMVEVYLRQQERGGKPVERGFSHPSTIAPIRLTNILARIEVRKEDDKERRPAIPTGILYAMGEGVSKSLAKASPNQEVVVMARERRRNMGIFTQDYLTSAILWLQGDRLYVKLGNLDTPLSKNPNDDVPEPKLDAIVGKNRVVPSDGVSAENAQLASADWRDPIFKDAGVISVRAGGKVVRRTVLMDSGEESTIPAEPARGAAVPPEGLSPEALRALADLEDERRRGEVTEADYQSKRRQILAGDLPAAAPAPVSAP